MQHANDSYNKDNLDYNENKTDMQEIGDVDELIFPDEEQYYISER